MRRPCAPMATRSVAVWMRIMPFVVESSRQRARTLPERMSGCSSSDRTRLAPSSAHGGEKRLVDAVLHMTERRMDLTMALLKEKPWDFCYVAFVGADRMQHVMWEEIISLDQHATEYYRLIDASIGLILDQLGPDDSLFVISDHGFQGVSTAFDINEFLLSRNLLKLSSDAQRNSARRSANLKHRMQQLGLLSLARKVKQQLEASGLVKKYQGDIYQPLLTDIDWQGTMAYVPSMSGFLGGYADIFLDEALDEESVARLREELQREVKP